MTDSLTQLVTLLEKLKTVSPCTRVTLVSHSSSNDAFMRVWMEMFEMILSNYRNIYGMPIMIFKLSGSRVYGAWGRLALNMLKDNISAGSIVQRRWLYIEDVVASLSLAMQREVDCTVTHLLLTADRNPGVVGRHSRQHDLNRLGTAVEDTLKWAACIVQNTERTQFF